MSETTVEQVLDRTFQHLETVVKEINKTRTERVGQPPVESPPDHDGRDRRLQVRTSRP